MSTSSVRRLKERGGGGGKITAAASTTTTTCSTAKHSKTPVSGKSISSNGSGIHSIKKPSLGKENPPSRPTSRPRAASAKPTIRSMPRIDKSSAMMEANNSSSIRSNEAVGESRSGSRARWSTSSVPRGRSPSPSEFTRVLSDMKKGSRVSLDRPVQEKRATSNSNSRVSGKKSELDRKISDIGKWVSNISEKNETFRENEANFLDNKKDQVRGLSTYSGNDASFPSVSVKSNRVDSGEKDPAFEEENSLSCVERSVELGLEGSSLSRNVDVRDKTFTVEEVNLRSGVELASKGSRMVTKVSGLAGVSKEKGVNDAGKGSGLSVSKYPSKLHEKLAFLEGKVKRIASDIKKTKEMLDMNNPDASKVVLSDIQEKISGIEKAMCNVVNSGDAKVKLLKSDESGDAKVQLVKDAKTGEGRGKESGKREEKPVAEGKYSVNELSMEELEARLFPHHKLLRDRSSVKPSSMSLQVDEMEAGKPTNELKMVTEDNPVALDFLAPLSEQSQVVKIDGIVNSEISEVQEMDGALSAAPQDSSSNLVAAGSNLDIILTTNEKLDELEDTENKSSMVIEEETESSCAYLLNEIGNRTSTGGWFVSEGESVLLAHDDGSCTYYDITNSEEKAEYRPPVGVSPNMWRDCWIVRAPGADGCSGRYVVAASAGNSIESGFCSWDFYTKDVHAFHTEDGTANVRTALADLPNNTMYRRNTLSTSVPIENQQWWYKPCGPLIVSTASCQRSVKVYDIRDGEHIMKWELQKPVAAMDYSSPLQWRNRGKVVVAEADTISLWDVSSLSPQALLSVSSANRKILALHVNNTDAELGGGVRQRVSSSEVEGNDGVFCTADSINVLDFRQPSGIGLKIPKVGVNVQSVFSRGDSVLIGCTSLKSTGKKQFCTQIQQFSLRKQRPFSTYVVPESDAHFHYKAITQVWGNSSMVMGVCGLGLYVFDSANDEGSQPLAMDHNVREIIGPDDLYSPSFDYLASRVLLISRDRPAQWRYLQ